MMGLTNGEDRMILSGLVSDNTVTDEQTDGETDVTDYGYRVQNAA